MSFGLAFCPLPKQIIVGSSVGDSNRQMACSAVEKVELRQVVWGGEGDWYLFATEEESHVQGPRWSCYILWNVYLYKTAKIPQARRSDRHKSESASNNRSTIHRVLATTPALISGLMTPLSLPATLPPSLLSLFCTTRCEPAFHLPMIRVRISMRMIGLQALRSRIRQTTPQAER